MRRGLRVLWRLLAAFGVVVACASCDVSNGEPSSSAAEPADALPESKSDAPTDDAKGEARDDAAQTPLPELPSSPVKASGPQEGAPLGSPAADYDDDFAVIRREAEDGQIVNPAKKVMRVVADDGASGGKCIEIPDKVGIPKDGVFARLVFKIDIPKRGHYTFWCRRFWPDQCADTLVLRFDREGRPRRNLKKETIFGSDDSSKPPRWGWSPVYRNGKPRQFYLRAGAHVLEILNREDGPRFDVILLTNDPDYVPTGLEKD